MGSTNQLQNIKDNEDDEPEENFVMKITEVENL